MIHGLSSHLCGFREAMHYAADFGCRFLPHDPQGIGRRFPRMNDQRLAGLPCSPDVRAKALPLPLGIALDPVIVQTGFPDGDNLGVSSQSNEPGNVRLLAGSVIRVNARRGKYVGKALCDRQHVGKGFKIYRNTKRMRDAVRGHRARYAAEISRQFGKIDMAVRIYKQFG